MKPNGAKTCQNEEPSSNSSFSRRLRRFFRPWWVRLICGVAILVSVTSFVNDWRWERKWAAYEREARGRGVKILLPEYRPAPVADDENFAATPFWKEVFAQGSNSRRQAKLTSVKLPPKTSETVKSNARPPQRNLAHWRAGLASAKGSAKSDPSISDAEAVLKGLEFLQPELDELREGTKRPYCVFPLKHEDGAAMELPHYTSFRAAERVFSVRSYARLLNGDGAGALDDLKTLFALAEKLDTEPTMIAGLVQISIGAHAHRNIADGLDAGRWSEAELREITTLTGRVNAVRRYAFAIQSERAFMNSLFSSYMENRRMSVNSDLGTRAQDFYLSGRSYVRRNQIWINSFFDEELTTWNVEERRWEQKPRTYSPLKLKLSFDAYFYIQAAMFTPVYEMSGNKFLEAQANSSMSVIACALERHKMSRGSYPEKLDALMPDFLTTTPLDPCNGESFHYSISPDGYLLYSVGINLKDDGGALAVDEYDTSPDWRWWSPRR